MSQPDLVSAVVAQIRLSSTVMTALAENTSYPSTTKVWSDHAEGQPRYPYVVVQELEDEDRIHESPDPNGVFNCICRGNLTLIVYASGKKESRDIARMLATSLDDAPMTFSDGTLIYFRSDGHRSIEPVDMGPLAPIVYARVVTFLYIVNRTY